jgi:hypothetical protein
MIKLLYKPVDLIAGMVGGLFAGLIFKAFSSPAEVASPFLG